MSGVRSMLARVNRLEIAEVSPLQRQFGSVAEFEAGVRAGIESGAYDPRDMAAVSAAVKRWMGQGGCDHVLATAEQIGRLNAQCIG